MSLVSRSRHTAAYHPESVAFHREHGVDITGTGTWESHHNLRNGQWTADRVGTDPEEYRVGVRRGAATPGRYPDGNAAVTRTERVRREEQNDRRPG